MPACATQNTIAEQSSISNLFLPVPDTDFREFLEEVEKLGHFAPTIIEAIEKDLDAHARKKKQLREEDRKFLEGQTADFPEFDNMDEEGVAGELRLSTGRPRMPAYSVYIFLMIRGFLGSLTSKPARRFMLESMTLYNLLQSWGMKMPGATTILENVNAVSYATRELIFDKQVENVLGEKLDDFKRLTIDSTSVSANTCWPTDSKILTTLLERIDGVGEKFHIFGLKDFCKGHLPRWLREMEKLNFQICLSLGKANSKGKRKKLYRKLLKRGRQALKALNKEVCRLEQDLRLDTFLPSRRRILERMLDQLHKDLVDVDKVLEYTEGRVFIEKKYKSTEKVLSLSDGSAAYIQKGGRDPVIGYKPQLVRSRNGFVTSLLVPEGNASDSVKLVPAIADSIERTGVVAEWVSTDDGYSSAKGRNELLELGVEHVSISGAKGKKLTDPEDWQSEPYQEERRSRSAVESLMFTIKHGFEFGELGRRGINAAREELLEKVLAYNCCRSILLKKRRQEELCQAA